MLIEILCNKTRHYICKEPLQPIHITGINKIVERLDLVVTGVHHTVPVFGTSDIRKHGLADEQMIDGLRWIYVGCQGLYFGLLFGRGS